MIRKDSIFSSEVRRNAPQKIKKPCQPRLVDVAEGGLATRSHPLGMLLSHGFADAAEELGISVHCLGHGRRADYAMARDFPNGTSKPSARKTAISEHGLRLNASYR